MPRKSDSARSSFLASTSLRVRPVSMARTPQLQSKPTPATVTTPSFTSKAPTPPMGNP